MSQAAVDPVTARYVEALYNLAQDKGQFDEVRRDVAQLGAECRVPEIRAFLADSRVDREEKRKHLEPVLKEFQPLTANLVHLALDRDREGVLIHLAPAFEARVLKGANAAEGVVESARPMEQADIDALAEALQKMLGKRVILKTLIVPELVGGIRITIDNKLIDYSVRGRLEGLHRRMLESPLPSVS